MEAFKIMEWNINHRQGYSNINMPEWVATVIREENADADIIILTECSSNVPNWETIKNRMFADKKYFVFESFNNQGHQNDVLIAVKKDRFSVKCTKSYYSMSFATPDHLEVQCKTKAGTEITVIGLRMHAYKPTDHNDEIKCDEFRTIIDSVKDKEIVIIGGDFNNYRRGCTWRKWCLNRIDEICKKSGFIRYTPNGSSIYEDYTENSPNAFAEDHFIVKGAHSVLVEPYNRSFVHKDTIIYRWGRDFQQYCGKDILGNNIYECVSDPYPDHAILAAEISI